MHTTTLDEYRCQYDYINLKTNNITITFSQINQLDKKHTLNWHVNRTEIIMGVKSGGKTLHFISGMTINDLVELLKGYAKQHGTNRPIVVVDCNNLLYIFSQAKNAVVEAVVNHLIKFANHGIIMVPVVDGVRPMCKQATNKRGAAWLAPLCFARPAPRWGLGVWLQ